MAGTDQQLAGPEEAPKPTVLFEAAIVISLAVAVLALFLFAWLGNEVMEGDTHHFDQAVRNWVHQYASAGMTRTMTAISLLGYNILILEMLIAFAVFAWLRWRRAVVLAGRGHGRSSGARYGPQVCLPSHSTQRFFWRCTALL